MSHTPTPTSLSRPGSRLTPSQIRQHPQSQSQSQSQAQYHTDETEEITGRISNISLGIHPPNYQQQHTMSSLPGPPPAQPLPFGSLPPPALYSLQDYPTGTNSNLNSNGNQNQYWNASSASAPGSGYTYTDHYGGGFGSNETSPITGNFPGPFHGIDHFLDQGAGHVHGQGQGQVQMVDIHGNPAGQTQGQGQQRTGYTGTAPRRRDSINNHGFSDYRQGQSPSMGHYGRGYNQQDHLDSVPSSPMTMSAMGMASPYYNYGAELNSWTAPTFYRGNRGNGKHQNKGGGQRTNRQSYRPGNGNDYQNPNHVPMGSIGSPTSSSFSHNHSQSQQGGNPYTNQMIGGQVMPIQYGLHPNYTPGIWRGGMNAYNRRENLTPRSPLLEEFRMNKSARWNITHIKDHIVEFCGDQHGSRFIQQRLESGMEEEINIVLNEIESNLFALMMDVFGNYVIQKLFEVCDQNQKMVIGKKMEGNVYRLSMEMYGCRVVQKAFEHVLNDQKDRLVGELNGKVIDCVKDNNGNHVIQRLITLDGCPDFVPRSFTRHVSELATHPYGCRVLQKTFECLPVEQTRDLLEEMHQNILKFTNDSFGNYVVQSMITSTTAQDRSRVISAFMGNLQNMARHKFASNVIEKALQHGDLVERENMIQELIGEQSDGTNQVYKLLKDAYGNFPIQTALKVAETVQREQLLEMIKAAMPQLKHTPVGKRLEMKINEIESGVDEDNQDPVNNHGDEHLETENPGYIPLSHSPSTSPSNSETLSYTNSSGIEDKAVISSGDNSDTETVTDTDPGLYSPDMKSRTSSKIRGGRRQDEELVDLLQ